MDSPSTAPLGGTRARRDQLAEDWLLSQRSASTAGPYRIVIAAFIGWCDRQSVDPLSATRRDVDRYRHYLVSPGRPRGPLNAATAYRHLSTISSWYRFGIQEGWLDANPVDAIRRPVVDTESRAEGLSINEAQRLLSASIKAGPRTAALVHLLLSTGARVSEMCSATTSSLGWDSDGARALRVVRKGGKEALISIQPAFWAVVDRYLQERLQGPDGPLLMTQRGPMSRQTAYQIISDLARQVVPQKRISPHSLRHTAATLALDAGEPLQEVQEMLGHRAPATTLRYDRARGTRGRAASRAVADILTVQP